MTTGLSIAILSAHVECQTFTLAYVCSHETDHHVTVIAPPAMMTSPASERYAKRIDQLDRVQVVAEPPPDARFDRLIVEGWRQTPRDLLRQALRQAKRVTYITLCDQRHVWPKRMRYQMAEAVRKFPAVRRADRFVFVNGDAPGNLFRLLAPCNVLGYDAHSSFILEPGPHRAMFVDPWSVQEPRPFRLSFMGNHEPQRRREILNRVEAELSRRDVKTVNYAQLTQGETAPVLWSIREVIEPVTYAGLLTQSDFTLSPPGYSPATHRTIESLLRGCIPIMNAEELQLYDLDLSADQHVLAVRGGDWVRALDHALRMSQDEIVARRSSIRELVEKHMSISATSARMRRRLAVNQQVM